jgi:hypothetical protein
LDLKLNAFRNGKPSDMTCRSSPVAIPDTWLKDPSLIDTDSKTVREAAWAIVWSIFERDDQFHPDDHFDILGDQDEANFM